MALSLNEIKIRAQQFVLNWKDKAATAREEADAQTFENEFFAIFGVPRNQHTPTQASGYVVLIRWLQSALIPFVTMQSEQTAIQRRLLSMQDMQYRDFNSKLIPTVDQKLMIGIRTPLLRKFAKELFKTEPEQTAAFMHDLPHRYFEENNLHAFLIENIKDFNAAMDETEKFLPFIDNWADRA